MLRRAEGIELTEAGELLLEHARGILADTDAVLERLRELQAGEASGRLRFMCTAAVAPWMLSTLVNVFLAAMPRIELEAMTAADPFHTALMPGDVVAHFSHGPAPTGWSTFELGTCPERVLASKDYCERHGVPRSIEDLERHDVWCWRHPKTPPLITAPQPHASSPKKRVIINAVDVLRRVLHEHRGVVVMPDAEFVEPEYPDTTIVHLLPEHVRACNILVSTPKASTRSRKVQTVLEQLEHVAASVPRSPRLRPPSPH